MCFVLYAGTSRPMPRRLWKRDAPGLSVKSLTERESPIAAHFSMQEVQYIGSTSQCGCDFPHVIHQSGGWPWFDDGEPETESDRYNREELVTLLKDTGESRIELYGIWDGNFATPPLARENISVETILDRGFRFKEGGFYVCEVNAG